MQIVIDISQEIITDIKENYDGYNVLYCAVKNGTPLPKGHGRLIECERLQEVFKRNVVGYAGFKQLFDIAPTIIEADAERDKE